MTRTQIAERPLLGGAPGRGDGPQSAAAGAPGRGDGPQSAAAGTPGRGMSQDQAADAEYRRAEATDCEAIRSFVAGLSPHTRLLRFFTPVSPPSSAVLRAMCGTDGAADVLVATHDGAIVAHAMAVDITAPDGCRAADIGLVVADDWQDRGVGSEILGLLVARVAARAVHVLVMDVLAENDRMLAMISRRWPDAAYQFAAGAVTVRVGLPGAAAGADGACGGTAPRAA
jgi:GNAT superfamily N-acetyltransferase